MYVLRELLRRLRKHNPNAYIMTENCGDIYGSYTWGNLTWNGAEYDEYYNVFKYTFPEFVQVNMVNPRGWETEDRDQRLWFYRDMHRAVTLGSVLWMGITTRMRPQDGEYHIYGRKMAAVPQGTAAAAQGSALFGRRLAGACAGLLLCGLLAACGRARNGAGGQ